MNLATCIRISALGIAGATSFLTACATSPAQSPATTFNQSALPTAIQVPAGNRVFMETVGVGEITYECRQKAGNSNEFEWVFVGPKAVLNDRAGKQIGTYYGPPATWEGSDGAKVSGAQVAIAPAPAGNIPLQLVKANPASGKGWVSGTTFIQRVATKGGVAPSVLCNSASLLSKQIVKYESDYIFWRSATEAKSGY
jgi:hypothetical protein